MDAILGQSVVLWWPGDAAWQESPAVVVEPLPGERARVRRQDTGETVTAAWGPPVGGVGLPVRFYWGKPRFQPPLASGLQVGATACVCPTVWDWAASGAAPGEWALIGGAPCQPGFFAEDPAGVFGRVRGEAIGRGRLRLVESGVADRVVLDVPVDVSTWTDLRLSTTELLTAAGGVYRLEAQSDLTGPRLLVRFASLALLILP